jgi:hypothetical protein
MRKSRLAICLAFFISTFLFVSPIYSQENLISNPGFEKDSNRIANKFSLVDDDDQNNILSTSFLPDFLKGPPPPFISDWTHPTEAIPGYLYGNQKVGWDSTALSPAHSGKSRVGMKLFCLNSEDGDDDDKQFLQTQLKEPLVAGQKYYFEFYLKMDWASEYYADNLEAQFSAEPINPDASLNEKPQITITSLTILTDTSWRKAYGCFTAKGGEDYLTFGSFDFGNPYESRKPNHSGRFNYYEKHKMDMNFMGVGYYYVDDFLLTKDVPSLHPAKPIPANNVVMLVDVSRSMYDGKYMDQLKSELKNFISGEGAGTKITFITFGSGIKILSHAAILTDTSAVDSLLNSIEEGGATNIEQALTRGYALADSLNDTASQTKIILFSDAQFQLNKKEEKLILHYSKEKNIGLVVYHYGKMENQQLEKTLAKCGGQYAKAGYEVLSKIIPRKEILVDSCGCN